ncbi:MAG TPA: hypothetical protein VEY93_16050 [Longimicrobium sp.]|nr:hypothetical protein [Longimicrobium sp.]
MHEPRSRAIRRPHGRALAATLVLFAAAMAVLAGCGQGDDEPAPAVALDGLPRWKLERQAVIDREFGSVAALAVDSRGVLYVADGTNQRIEVVAPDGRHLATLGRRGEGPGEFQGLRDLAVGLGDTLFAFDVQAQRVTAFAGEPEPHFARAVSLARSGERANYHVLVPESGGILVPYVVPATEATADARRTMALRHLARDQPSASRPVLQVPEKQFLVSRDPSFGVSVGSLPYGREPLVRLGPGDRLYYAWSDQFAVHIYDLAGRETGRFQVPFASERVLDEDIRTLLDSYGSDPMAQLGRKQLERAHSEGRLPRTKPVLKSFVVDDRGRVWASVMNADDVLVSTGAGLAYRSRRPDALAEWVVVGADGKPLATARLSHGTTLRVIQRNLAYGIDVDELGVQRVVRFAVRP